MISGSTVSLIPSRQILISNLLKSTHTFRSPAFNLKCIALH